MLFGFGFELLVALGLVSVDLFVGCFVCLVFIVMVDFVLIGLLVGLVCLFGLILFVFV